MKTCIISYSFTGNNERFAKALAQAINAQHMPVKEDKERTMFKIITDMMFFRTPHVQPSPDTLKDYDHVIFMGPIWMQQAASPLRSYFKWCKKQAMPYSFITISGGALNDNPKLQANIQKIAGDQMTYYRDFHIAKLLTDAKATAKDTSQYQLTEDDIQTLTANVVDTFKTS